MLLSEVETTQPKFFASEMVIAFPPFELFKSIKPFFAWSTGLSVAGVTGVCSTAPVFGLPFVKSPAL